MGHRLVAIFLILVGAITFADDAGRTPWSIAAEEFRRDPSSEDKMEAYIDAIDREFARRVKADASAADQLANEMGAFLDTLKPATDEAKELRDGAVEHLAYLRRQSKLAHLSLDEVKDRLRKTPESHEAWNTFDQKYYQVFEWRENDPRSRQALLVDVEAFLGVIAKDAAASPIRDERILQSRSNLKQLKRILDSDRARDEAPGKPAVPLSLDGWVNGSPLTEADLKGKVVLLDFTAVWCAPCLKTLPELRALDDQYRDKGLVIVGVTRFYNYSWDEKSASPAKRDEPVPEAVELAMLGKFADHHRLKYRLAVERGESVSEAYGLNGIPQIVLIDRAGIVRLIRRGDGAEEAKAVREAIQKLLD